MAGCFGREDGWTDGQTDGWLLQTTRMGRAATKEERPITWKGKEMAGEGHSLPNCALTTLKTLSINIYSVPTGPRTSHSSFWSLLTAPTSSQSPYSPHVARLFQVAFGGHFSPNVGQSCWSGSEIQPSQHCSPEATRMNQGPSMYKTPTPQTPELSPIP